MKRVLLSAGEPSGDSLAAGLAEALSEREEVSFFGLGGPLSEQAGVELVQTYEGLSVVGFQEALGKLRQVNRVRAEMVNAAKAADLAIFIDFPGFNIGLARRVKALGVPTVYYSVPQVWAWGGWRVRLLRRCIDLFLTLLPFEEEYLSSRGLCARYVGHPLFYTASRSHSLSDVAGNPVFGLLPGSRGAEVRRMSPRFSRIVKALTGLFPDAGFLISQAERLESPPLVEGARVVRGAAGVIDGSDLVLATSGTVALETALRLKPAVVLYVLSELSYLLARRLIRVRHISLANILAGRTLQPEFVQSVHPERVAGAAARMLEPGAYRDNVEELARLRERLYISDPYGKAAEEIARRFF